jgi:hypothetical protein
MAEIARQLGVCTLASSKAIRKRERVVFIFAGRFIKRLEAGKGEIPASSSVVVAIP